MLPRGQRLNTACFATAFMGGRVLRHPLMQVRVLRRRILPDQRSSQMRAAFVVPKKLGKAARRNRLRRRVREIFRLHPLRVELSALCDCDLIFVMAPPALAATSTELAEAVTQLLRRASRLEMQKSHETANKVVPNDGPGA